MNKKIIAFLLTLAANVQAYSGLVLPPDMFEDEVAYIQMATYRDYYQQKEEFILNILSQVQEFVKDSTSFEHFNLDDQKTVTDLCEKLKNALYDSDFSESVRDKILAFLKKNKSIGYENAIAGWKTVWDFELA